MCFSSLAVLSVIQNFLQLVTIKFEGKKGKPKKIFEGVVDILLAIATIVILF